MRYYHVSFITVLLAVWVGCSLNSKPPVQTVVSNWGGVSRAYDDRIVDYVLTSVDGVHTYDMDSAMLDALVLKIRSNPALLKQIFIRYSSGTRGAPSCDDSDWFIARLIRDMKSDPESHSRKAVNVFLLASMFGRAEWVTELSWLKIDSRWHEVSEYVSRHQYYVVYDRTRCEYVIDEAAQLNGERVVPARQTWLVCD